MYKTASHADTPLLIRDLPIVVARVVVAASSLILLVGWLLRYRAIRRCQRNGGMAYGMELIYILVPIVPAAFLDGLVILTGNAISIRSVEIMSVISIVLSCVSSMYMHNRVELYGDRCISVSGIARSELSYSEIQNYSIVGEKGASKVTFFSRYGAELHFYSSISRFHSIVDTIMDRSGLVRRDNG